MDVEQYLAALERDGAAFAASAQAAGLTTSVASCPEWNVADLVWHLGEVLYFWGSIVKLQAASWDVVVEAERVPDAEVLAYFDRQFADILVTLRAADPATSVWTWSAQHDVAFIIRRMAQETAVHRWDADVAAGRPVAIEAALASDGVDEFLEHFLDHGADTADDVNGSVHLHCTDVAGEWTVRAADQGGLVVTREHAKGDCALRGAASDLLLALWRRVPLSAVDVIGDAAVAERFVAATTLT